MGRGPPAKYTDRDNYTDSGPSTAPGPAARGAGLERSELKGKPGPDAFLVAEVDVGGKGPQHAAARGLNILPAL